MTENEFRDLLYHLDGKLQVNKVGASGNIWVAMGELVNKSTKEDKTKNIEVKFNPIISANHFYKNKEKELASIVEDYLKDKITVF